MLNVNELPHDEGSDRLREALGDFHWFAPVQLIVARKAPPEVESGPVKVLVPGDLPFPMLMVMAEYLSHLCAQKSGAGYEKALDLIRAGAMTYRTKRV